MKINPAKLTLEDFPKQRDWIGKLFSIWNQFVGEVVNGFSNQITVEDNLYQELKDVKFKNSVGDFPLKFRTKFAAYPKGVLAVYLFDHDLNEPSNEPHWIKWSFADNQVVISEIDGLTADKTYTIRLLVIYG